MRLIKTSLGAVIAVVLMAGGCASLETASEETPQDKAEQIIKDSKDKPNKDKQAKDKAASEEKPSMTTAQANAVRTAENYLSMSGFSEKSLTEQLVFEGYSKADSKFAIKALSPNWMEEAAQSAKDYVDMSGFSRSGLIEQLMFEGYTRAQAEHGATAAGL